MNNEKRPTGAIVHVNIHPGLPPAMAMGVFVSAEDQAWQDFVRRQSYQLAIQRGHIRT